jgi:hypothetical protein
MTAQLIKSVRKVFWILVESASNCLAEATLSRADSATWGGPLQNPCSIDQQHFFFVISRKAYASQA